MEKKIFSARLPHKLINFLSLDKQINRILKKLNGLDQMIQPFNQLPSDLASVVLLDSNELNLCESLNILAELSQKDRKLTILAYSNQLALLKSIDLDADFYEIPETKGIGDVEIKELEAQISSIKCDCLWNLTHESHPLDLYLACLTKPELRIGFSKEKNPEFINFKLIYSKINSSSLRGWFRNDFQYDSYWETQGQSKPEALGNEILIPYAENEVPTDLVNIIKELQNKRTPLRFISQWPVQKHLFSKARAMIYIEGNLICESVKQLGLCPTIVIKDD